MPSYFCCRCGYNSQRISGLKDHLTKKKPCDTLYSDVDRAALLASLSSYDGKKACKTLTIAPKTMTKEDAEKIEDKGAFIVKMLNDNVKLQKRVDELTKANAELKQQVGGVTNNNIVNNNIHIHINNFGQENLEYVTNDFLSKAIRKIYDSVPTLLKHIHFNPEHPENHNVRMPNKRDKYMLVRRGGEWRHEDRRMVLDDMVNSGHDCIETRYADELLDGMPDYTRECFSSYMAKMSTDEARSNVRSRVEVMLLDSRCEVPVA